MCQLHLNKNKNFKIKNKNKFYSLKNKKFKTLRTAPLCRKENGFTHFFHSL